MKSNKLLIASIVFSIANCCFKFVTNVTNFSENGAFTTLKSCLFIVISTVIFALALAKLDKKLFTIYYGFNAATSLINFALNFKTESIVSDCSTLIINLLEYAVMYLIVMSFFKCDELGAYDKLNLKKKGYFSKALILVVVSMLVSLALPNIQMLMTDSVDFAFETLISTAFSMVIVRLFFILALALASKKLFITNYVIMIIVAVLTMALSPLFDQGETSALISANSNALVSVISEMLLIIGMFKAFEIKKIEATKNEEIVDL